MGEQTYFEGLNPKQLSAARHRDGKALVNAGAGTGKTKTLVARYLSLILDVDKPVSIHEVLAITYTNPGAEEMQQRIQSGLEELGHTNFARQMGQAWISTIHGFCGRILRRYALQAGIDPYFREADDVEAQALKSAALDELFENIISSPKNQKGGQPGTISTFETYLQLRKTHKDPTLRKEIVTLFDSLRKYGCDPTKERSDWPRELMLDDQACSLDSSDSKLLLDLVQDFARVYIRLCEERGLIDFTDILLRAYELLQQKGPREELQRQFKFVMLDEAQDTNQLQLDIVNAIAGDNLYQVGDVKQSIYRFHGTDPALIRAYHQEIEKQGGGLYDLDDNYRSARGVLSFANALFGNDELLGHSAAALKAHHDNDFFQQAGECVQLLEIAAHNSKGKPDKSLARKEEARWIADRFLEMRKHRSSWSEFVVLVGSRPQAGELLQEFKQRGMPAKLVKGGGLFDNPMVKEARCFLEMLTKPRDPGTFLRLLLGKMGRVSDQGIYELACLRREAELDFLWDAALYILDEEHEQRAEQILSLESDRVALIGLVESIQDARSTLGVRPLSEILSRAFCKRDLDLYYLAGGSSAGAGQGAGLVGRQIYGGFQEFLRLVDDWQAAGKDPFSFSDELKRQEDLGFAPEEEAISVPEEECIVIDSVHSSKGKEFPIVALALTGSSEDKNDKTSYALHLSSEPGAQDEGVAQNSALVLTSHKKLKPENYYSPRYEDLHAQHGEESRLETARLLYVGCTRAENQLLIAYNKNAKGGLSASMVRGIDQAQREMTALKEEGYLAHERIEK